MPGACTSVFMSADCKRVGGKGPRRKNVKRRQDEFRHFSTVLAQGNINVKNRQEVSKIIFDSFRQFARGTKFSAPLK